MKDLEFMQRALVLAEKGRYNVSPNPMVGCVIVHQDQIVSEGYHKAYGSAHAEVEAVNALPLDVVSAECVVYVTLEPCSHHGKTPPCAELLIKRGFKKVVVACKDPNPLVSGNGIRLLREAGIEVLVGVLEQEARVLNRQFICFHEKQRPFVLLKWAQSADGYISRLPVPAKREENLISGAESSAFVQNLRADVMAILVGKNTVLADNPRLNNRSGKGKQPWRIVLDKNLELDPGLAIFDAGAGVLIVNAIKEGVVGHLHYLKLDFNHSILPNLLLKMSQLGIQSVMVEGGKTTLESFIAADLWDEAIVIENTALMIRQGVKAPDWEKGASFEQMGGDRVYRRLK